MPSEQMSIPTEEFSDKLEEIFQRVVHEHEEVLIRNNEGRGRYTETRTHRQAHQERATNNRGGPPGLSFISRWVERR